MIKINRLDDALDIIRILLKNYESVEMTKETKEKPYNSFDVYYIITYKWKAERRKIYE